MCRCCGRFNLLYRVNVNVYDRLAILAVEVPLDDNLLGTNTFDRVAPVVRNASVTVDATAMVYPELTAGKGGEAVCLDADVVYDVVIACIMRDIICTSVDVNDSGRKTFGRVCPIPASVGRFWHPNGQTEQRKGDSDYSKKCREWPCCLFLQHFSPRILFCRATFILYITTCLRMDFNEPAQNFSCVRVLESFRRASLLH